MKVTNIGKRLKKSIGAVLLLVSMITINAMAVSSNLQTVVNVFTTGEIKINLNGSETIFSGVTLLEPGDLLTKTFFVQNESTCDVYCKLESKNVTGVLANVLEVELLDDSGIQLYEGKLSDLLTDAITLAANERNDLTFKVNYPAYAGNDGQGGDIVFDIVATAVQAKNNDSKSFDTNTDHNAVPVFK